MVSYTQEITLDINTNTAYPIVSAKQGDEGSRWILVHLTKDNVPYSATPGNNAQFRCRKPDGHAIINPAIINNDGSIGVELTAQTLISPGRAYADIVESDNNGNILSSVAFILLIMAAPSVASTAISSDEFQKLNELVARSDELISQAEAWAIGTKNNQDIGPAIYEQDNVTSENFESKKSYLFIKVDNEYVPLDDSAVFDNSQIYYVLTVGNNNNAKYYSEQAKSQKEKIEQLQVSSTTLQTGSPATVNKTINPETGILTLAFGLPAGIQGIQGDRGPGTVWIGTEEPEDEAYEVWLNPEGTSEPVLLTAEQMSYDSSIEYTDGRIGAVVKSLQNNISAAINAAEQASQAAAEAAEAASQVTDVVDRVSTLETDIVKKIENPQLQESQTFGILTTNSTNIQWQEKLDYETDLNNLPSIEDIPLKGNLSLINLGIAPAAENGKSYYIIPDDGIPGETLSSNVQNSLTLANNAVSSIIVNGITYSADNRVVDLGNFLTDNNTVNRNYLDNPWFTVNQHGAAQYSSENPVTANTYIYDRWKVLKNETETRSLNNGDNLLFIGEATNSEPNDVIEIGQLIDDDVWQALSGKQVTASVNYALRTNEDFQTTSWSFICPTYDGLEDSGSEKEQFDTNYGWGAQVIVKEFNNKKYLVFKVFWQGNAWGPSVDDCNIYIAKTKLELGSFSTLDQEAAPVYNEELKKCQRYFRHYDSSSVSSDQVIVLGSGVARDSQTLDISISGIGDMINSPSIAITSGANFEARRGLGATTTANQPVPVVPTALTVSGKSIGDILCVTATRQSGPTFASYYPYYLVLPRTVTVTEGEETLTYVNFSAEP